MATLVWNKPGDRVFHTGLNRGVLYLPDGSAVPWNGLTSISESNDSASNPYYIDGVKFLETITIGDFAAQLKAITYPSEFDDIVGVSVTDLGLAVYGQPGKPFGLSYKTLLGDDVVGAELGYKLHLLYNLFAVPDTLEYKTLQSSADPVEFQWKLSSIPVVVPGFKPTTHISLDSTRIEPQALEYIEQILYGASTVDPRLPLPTEIADILEMPLPLPIEDDSDAPILIYLPPPTDDEDEIVSPTIIRLSGDNAPTYDGVTHVVYLPSVSGIRWEVNGGSATAGAQPPLAEDHIAIVTAWALPGYEITGADDWAFDY